VPDTNTSYWIASTPETDHPSLDADIEVDALVIGGGLVGITTAYLLQSEGLRVALIEMDRVLHGATGNTTAKVTWGHGLIYQALEEKHGSETARLYGGANAEGLALLTRLVDEVGLDCDLQRKSNYIYVESTDQLDSIHREAEVCDRIGLPVRVVTDTTLPYPVAGAIEQGDQAQFHPRKYCLGLLQAFLAAGGSVYERSRATELDEGDICTVTTPRGSISTPYVVVATHYPFIDRALLFPRVHPKRSYAIAGLVDPSVLPEGMFISSDPPTRSVRTIPDGDRVLLMIGGEGHAAGQKYDTLTCYANLEKWAKDRFGMTEAAYRWSTQDGVSVDTVPFIGRYREGVENIFTATAFGKWGFTNGTIGSKLIADAILERDNAYADLYNPTRLPLKASSGKLLSENAKVAAHFFGDRAKHPQRRSLDELQPYPEKRPSTTWG
jgi:glycine/D-amino acid oxidase-like deaminating enzyme